MLPLPRLAAAWALLFAAVHLGWALGLDTGLATSAGRDLARDRPTWFVLVGLWGVAVALVVAGVAALTRARWSRFVVVLAAVLLTVRAVPTLVQDVLTEMGVLAAPDDWTVVHGRLWVWTPWFLLGAALFVGCALRLRRGADPLARTS